MSGSNIIENMKEKVKSYPTAEVTEKSWDPLSGSP